MSSVRRTDYATPYIAALHGKSRTHGHERRAFEIHLLEIQADGLVNAEPDLGEHRDEHQVSRTHGSPRAPCGHFEKLPELCGGQNSWVLRSFAHEGDALGGIGHPPEVTACERDEGAERGEVEVSS